jgi:hypothetical protein
MTCFGNSQLGPASCGAFSSGPMTEADGRVIGPRVRQGLLLLWSAGSGAALVSLPISHDCPAPAGTFTGPQMDPELRLLDLIRRDWWVLVIVVCIIWAIECRLEGNSVIETIEAPLLVVAWGGLILLIDRWALRHTRGVS